MPPPCYGYNYRRRQGRCILESRMPALPRLTHALPLLLAGCGSFAEVNTFAPPCPKPMILRDANDLFRYRGRGRDVTDSVLEGRITTISGSCKRDGSDAVAATVNV